MIEYVNKAIEELKSDMGISQYWIDKHTYDIYFEYIPDAALWGQGVFDVIAGRDKKWLLRLKYEDIYLYLKND